MLCNAKKMKEIGEKQVKTIECYVTDKGVKPETLGVIQMLHNTHGGESIDFCVLYIHINRL